MGVILGTPILSPNFKRKTALLVPAVLTNMKLFTEVIPKDLNMTLEPELAVFVLSSASHICAPVLFKIDKLTPDTTLLEQNTCTIILSPNSIVGIVNVQFDVRALSNANI